MPEDGLRRRRALIEKWTTASQEFCEVRIANFYHFLPSSSFIHLISLTSTTQN
jgi:hypothetical protein